MGQCCGCGGKYSLNELFDITRDPNHKHRFIVCAECKKRDKELEAKIALKYAESLVKFNEELEQITKEKVNNVCGS